MSVEVVERIGDILSVPPGSVIIHACNCQGAWGSGIAKAIKDKFPTAYSTYKDLCLPPQTKSNNAKELRKSLSEHKKTLPGTALLIKLRQEAENAVSSYWIACLFTSLHFGKYKDTPMKILENTKTALADLKTQLQQRSGDPQMSMFDGKLYTVRMNAASFAVPWEHTRRAISESGLYMTVMNNIDIMDPATRLTVLDSMEQCGQDVQKVKEAKARYTYTSNSLPTIPQPAEGLLLSSGGIQTRSKRKRDLEDTTEKEDTGAKLTEEMAPAKKFKSIRAQGMRVKRTD